MERVEIVGAGPAGLLLAILLRRSGTARHVRVHDRAQPEDTHGWAVVFPGGALDELAVADPEVHALVESAGVGWTAVDVRHGGHRRTVEGRGFRGMARARLVSVLDLAAAELGVVRVHGEVRPDDLREGGALAGADLLVGADGVGSVVRRGLGEHVRAQTTDSAAWFRWLGVDAAFPAFTYVFEETPWGLVQAYVYPSGESWSSLIVQVDDATRTAAGLDRMDDAELAGFLDRVLADPLDGARVLTGRSRWTRFRDLRCETWHHDRTVLLGDAAHTAHWSIGSGTRLAIGDAIELAARLADTAQVDTALARYEEARRPVVERYRAAAAASEHYFAHVHDQLRLPRIQFAYQLLTRSWKITHDAVRRADPAFAEEVERWFGAPGPDRRPTAAPWCGTRLRLAHRTLRRAVTTDAGPDGARFVGMTQRDAPGSTTASGRTAPGIVLVDLTGERAGRLLAAGGPHVVKELLEQAPPTAATGAVVAGDTPPEDLVDVAAALLDAGAELLVVRAPRGADVITRTALVHATAAVRARVGVAVAVEGVARDHDEADTIIAAGWADLWVVPDAQTEEGEA